MRALPLAPLLVAAIASCNGDCSSNAVAITTRLQALGPTVSTIEVYSDRNSDGYVGPQDAAERAFVVDPRPTIRKVLRIEFLMEVPREHLAVTECEQDPCDSFLSFASFIEPAPAGSPWVVATYFNDDPAVTNASGTARVVTYELHDNLVGPLLTSNPIPVTVTVHLDRLGYEPFDFAFVLARQFGIGGERVPPRTVEVIPAPSPGQAGWGRQISVADFAPCTQPNLSACLDSVLAQADEYTLGDSLVDRVSPHQPISLTFDDPMSNLVASVDPLPDVPTAEDPAGIELTAPTIAFVTPFATATSDTAVGMAPDRVYVIRLHATAEVENVPFLSTTQNDQGQVIIPNFDDEVYDALRSEGYTDLELGGAIAYQFRTGPFRTTAPRHRGNTNRHNAPNGVFQAALQFATPSEGIATPTLVTTIVTAVGQPTNTATLAFPAGVPDFIQQDGLPRREGDVTRHTLPILLPSQAFDDVVHIEMIVSSGPAEENVLGRDIIEVHHDVVAPSINAASVQIENHATDGYLDKVCVTTDCDVAGFVVAVGPVVRPACGILGDCAIGACDPVLRRCAISVTPNSTGACIGGQREFCFENVPLGISDQQIEGSVDREIFVVDDQGNYSSGISIQTPAPDCQIFDKFVGTDGRRSAIATASNGAPLVAWTSGNSLNFAGVDTPPAITAGLWVTKKIAEISLGLWTFGLGIDLVIDPLFNRPVVCYIEAPLRDLDGDGVPDRGLDDRLTLGTLHVLRQQENGEWTELSARAGVQPLGCSLATFGTLVVVGWLEAGQPQWSFAHATDTFAMPLPIPDGSDPDESPQPKWELQLVGNAPYIWFTYRNSVGGVYLGYTDVPGVVTRVQRECSQDCSGPSLLVDAGGVALAYVSHPGDMFLQTELVVRAGSLPAPGSSVAWSGRFTHDDVRPLSHLVADGLSPEDNKGNALFIHVPYSRPDLVRDHDGNLVVAWARGNLELGGEDVSVAYVDVSTMSGDVSVIDRRVQSDGAERREAVPVHVSQGPNGYFMIYRNAAAGRLVFASEKVTLPITGGAGSFACHSSWQRSSLSLEELNLAYVQPLDSLLWEPACAGTLTAPPRGLQIFRERLLENTALRDLITTTIFGVEQNIIIRNGRVPLRRQLNVCVPADPATGGPDHEACDPAHPLFGIEVPPTLVCLRGDQSCRNPQDCCSGSCRGGRCEPLSTGCPVTSQSDLDVGIMAWSPTPDGTECTRCTDGAAPHSCRTHEDCLMYGGPAAEDARRSRARCASNGVCVPRCRTDADCRGGRCDTISNPEDPGVCVNSTGAEQVANGERLCRFIGCDRCWNNDYCGSPGHSCPANHVCVDSASPSAEPVDTPACVMRPILSPVAALALDADQQASLKNSSDNLTNLLATIQVPNRIELDTVLDCEVTSFESQITDLHVTQVGDVFDMTLTMSRARLRICAENPRDFETQTEWEIHLILAPFVGPRRLGPNDTLTPNSFSGLSFSLVDVRVDDFTFNNFPDPDASKIEKALKNSIDAFAGRAMEAIVSTVTALRRDDQQFLALPGITRCMFGRPEVVKNLPQQCSRGRSSPRSMPDIWSVVTQQDGFIVNYESCP